MKIAITGSTGLLGTALHDAWGETHVITRVIRGPREETVSVWDPRQDWVRPGALDGYDVVVHLAGASIGSGRWSAARKAEIVASRVAGTRTLVRHLASLEHKPSLFISASAVGFYGSRGDEVLTEESALGAGFLANLCKDWEAEARAAEQAGIRTAILRLGVILSRNGGALGRMLLPFKLGAGGRIGSGKQWMAWVGLEDAVRAFDFVVRAPGAQGVYNVTAPNPATNAEFTKALGKTLKRPTLVPVPPFGLKLLLGGEMAQELILASQRVVPQRLGEAGFQFRQPRIADGLAAALGRGGG
ncbi:MAG: TIGR01777 family oxidoreductase [Dehalococcoidia bacterium]